MKFEPLQRTLRDGKILIVREAVQNDAKALVELVTAYGNDADMIPLEKGEFVPTIKQEEEWIRSFSIPPNSLLMLAEIEGRIVGNIDITGSHRRKLFHTASLGISVRKEFQGQGIGKELLMAALSWCTNNEFLELIWLQVYEDNEIARKMYEAAGFEVSGKQAEFFHEKRGRVGNVLMTAYLKKGTV